MVSGGGTCYKIDHHKHAKQAKNQHGLANSKGTVKQYIAT